MKRLWLGLLFAGMLAAQHAAEHEGGGHGGGHDNTTLWKLANFVILAGGLGYLIKKKGGGFFEARGRQIREGIEQAAKLRAEAEAKAAAMEQRVAGLEAEIEELKRSAAVELAAERERAQQQHQQDLARIQATTRQEIASLAKAARQELKAHAADLALKLAEQRLRAEMSPRVHSELVSAFLRDLERQGQAAPGPEVH